MKTTKTDRRNLAVFRELGIRHVIRTIQAGKPTRGYHASTVRAAQKRLAAGYVIPAVE